MSRDDPTAADAYRTFLEAKIATPPTLGLPCELDEVRAHLTDDQQLELHETLSSIGWPVATISSREDAFAYLRLCGAPWSGVPA